MSRVENIYADEILSIWIWLALQNVVEHKKQSQVIMTHVNQKYCNSEIILQNDVNAELSFPLRGKRQERSV